MNEAWERYKLPIAITEVHINCTREEQMRWFHEIWTAACAALKNGIDVRAVTAWSLLGAYNWGSLLTRDDQEYESGVFDTRNNTCRETGMGKMLRSLSAYGSYHHPLLLQKGWWHDQAALASPPPEPAHPVLIIGKSGTLANAFAIICASRNIPFVALSRSELNICSNEEIMRAIDRFKPWAIINASGYVRVDDAETDLEICFAINATGPGLLAACCQKLGIQLVTFSSDLVFDGNKQIPYVEEDHATPLNVYGRSKIAGEKLVTDNNPSSLIIRTSAFFGPWDKYNFVFNVLESLRHRKKQPVPDDVFVSPTYIPDLVHASLDLMIDEESGIWHLSNDGPVSWGDFADEISSRGGYGKNYLTKTKSCNMGWSARRPLYSVLKSGRGIMLPALDNALERFFAEIKI